MEVPSLSDVFATDLEEIAQRGDVVRLVDVLKDRFGSWREIGERLTPEDREDLDETISRHGQQVLVDLFEFTHEWKMGDWAGMRERRQTREMVGRLVGLGRDIFRPVRLHGLYRGVAVHRDSPLVRGALEPAGQSGASRWSSTAHRIDIDLPRRSVSSWTRKLDVAEKFAYQDPGLVSVVMQLQDQGDAVCLAAPPDDEGVPGWYSSLAEDLGARMTHEGEAERILSISRCRVRVVHLDDISSDPHPVPRLHRPVPDDYVSKWPKLAPAHRGREYQNVRNIHRQMSKGKVV